MAIHSFEDDLFEEGVVRTQAAPIKAKKQNPLTATWKTLYQEVYGVEFDRMDDPNLFNACVELNRFCKANNLDFSAYSKWGMENFEVFSPRRLMNSKFTEAHKNSIIPEDATGGFFVIETGEVVNTVFLEDGQIAFDIPSNGEVYIEGKKVHVMKV
jgi:hypothetical protein